MTQSKTGDATLWALQNVRSQRARMGAYAAAAKHGGRHMTRAARIAGPAGDEFWYRKTDPSLAHDERVRRAGFLKKQHFAGLSLRSAQARRRKAS